MPFPPLSAGASFPSQRAFFFLVYQALGKAGGQPDSQPSTPGRPPARSRRLHLWGQRLSTPSLHLTLAAPAWRQSPLPAWGWPPSVPGLQSLLSEALKPGGCLGYTEALSLTLGEKKLPTWSSPQRGSFVTMGRPSGPGAGTAWQGWTLSLELLPYPPAAPRCLP